MAPTSTSSPRGRDRASTVARVPPSAAVAFLAGRLAELPANGALDPVHRDPDGRHRAPVSTAQASRRRALTMLAPPISALPRSSPPQTAHVDHPQPRVAPPSKSPYRRGPLPAPHRHSPDSSSPTVASAASQPSSASAAGAPVAGRACVDRRLDGRRCSLIGPIIERPTYPASSPPRPSLDAQHYLRTRSGTVGAFSAGYSPLTTPASRHFLHRTSNASELVSSSAADADPSTAHAHAHACDQGFEPGIEEVGSGLVRASASHLRLGSIASPHSHCSPAFASDTTLSMHKIPIVTASSPSPQALHSASEEQLDWFPDTAIHHPGYTATHLPPRADPLPSPLPSTGCRTPPHLAPHSTAFMPPVPSSIPLLPAEFTHTTPHGAQTHGTVPTRVSYAPPRQQVAGSVGVAAGWTDAMRSSARPGMRVSREGLPPTRALWIGSLPLRLTNAALHTLFSQWGPLEGTRVLSLKQCAFVNYVSLRDATMAREQLSGTTWDFWDRTVGLGLGLDLPDMQDAAEAGLPIKVAYAKAAISTPGFCEAAVEDKDAERRSVLRKKMGLSSMPDGNAYSAAARERNMAHGLASSSNSIVLSSDKGGIALPPHLLRYCSVEEQRDILAQLGPLENTSTAEELPLDLAYDPDRPRRFGSILPAPPARGTFDPIKLRELRRRLDAAAAASCSPSRRTRGGGSGGHGHGSRGVICQDEVDGYAYAFAKDMPLLASDFHGNVVIQRLFEMASDPAKLAMLASLAPHLAQIGCHKNGTWVAQKVLECINYDPSCNLPPTAGSGAHHGTYARAPAQQLAMAVAALAPYIPPLLLDQYGNYVVQGLLRFGPPQTDAIFDAFLEQTWEIAQGRFGARAMRAVLDHPRVSPRQRRRAALAILLCAIPLACSSNGSILLHWLLDDTTRTFGASSTGGNRFGLVWDRLRPALPDLAIHKLASHVLLRLGTQTHETSVAQDLCAAIFSTVPRCIDNHDDTGTPAGAHVARAYDADAHAHARAQAGAQAQVQAQAQVDKKDEVECLVYRDVLLDQVHGSQLVAQLLCSPALRAEQAARYRALARTVLIQHDLVDVPAHRRLAAAARIPEWS